MFQLYLASGKPAARSETACRLSGIAIDCGSDPASCCEATDPHQAVAFIGAQRLDSALIDSLLRARKHVLCAGELNFSRREFESLAERASQNNARPIVVNPDRFLPSRQLIKSQIPDRIGHPGLIRMHRWEPAARDAAVTAGMPGPLLRDFDLATWLVGTTPTHVFAVQNTDPAGRSLQVHFGFDQGGMALIDYDNRLSNGDGYQSLSVIGSSGAAYADDHQNMQLLFRGGRPQAIRTDEGVKGLADMIRFFVDAIQGKCDPAEHAFDWQKMMVIADAVEQSLRTRQAVCLEGR